MKTLSYRFLTTAFCFAAASAAPGQVPGTGRVEIKQQHSYTGNQTLPKPTGIVVYTFTTGGRVKLNSGALNRVRTRRSGNAAEEKLELANRIVDSFSQSLVDNLQKGGLPVTRGVTGQSPPENSVTVQGDFSEIDEGNRARRMAIGLGSGASKVQTQVECYFKQPAANTLLTSFTATSQSSRKPGAAETMGAGAAPDVAAVAGGVTEMKQNAEGDADRMAKAVAKEIVKTLQSRGWVNEAK